MALRDLFPLAEMRLTRICSSAWLRVWRFADQTPHKSGRAAARDFASRFSARALRHNLRNNHAPWMAACGCLATCVSTGGKSCGTNSSGSRNQSRRQQPTRNLSCEPGANGVRLDCRSCWETNTLEVVRQAPGVSSKLDPQFIGDFLLQEWCGDGARTVYRDIHRLPPGHTLVYSDAGLCVRCYTDFSVEEPLWLKRPEEYVERFQELLEKAVRDRLPRGPCGIFLSGGLDSTSIAAVACKIAKRDGARGPLRAYTIDCRPMFNDEEGYLASLVAENLGINIEIRSGASCLPYEGWGDSLLRTPEPYHDPFLSLTQRLYRQVQADAPVVLSGYGGDDILTGQAWPYLTYLFRQRSFGTILKTFGRYILKHGRIPPLRGGFRTRLRRWMGRTNPLTEFPEWLEPHFAEQHNLRGRWRELQESPKTGHPLHPIAFAGLSSKLWSSTLESEDAGWIGAPVELRAPLLDQRLLSFLLRVPPVPWCMEKELLREAMRGMLPEEVRTRPKTPLLGDLIQQLIESKRWSPRTLPEPTAGLQTFVDGERLGTTLARAAGSTLWVGLRPVSLSYWLKGVVNEEGIR